MRLIVVSSAVLAVMLGQGCAPAAKPVVALVPPPAPPFCTRTLGVAECFADPARLPDHPAPIADGPLAPAPAPPDTVPTWQRVLDWATR